VATLVTDKKLIHGVLHLTGNETLVSGHPCTGEGSVADRLRTKFFVKQFSLSSSFYLLSDKAPNVWFSSDHPTSNVFPN